jgi:GDP-D-mannose 3',5'-epimerase
MIKQKTALVLGAGGFIGTHLVRRLKSEGYWVRGVDLKYPEFSETEANDFVIADLRHFDTCAKIMNLNHGEPFENKKGFDEIYQLGALMGGAGFIFTGDNDADVMYSSAKINLNVAYLANEIGCGKIFYSSSACMYPQQIQENTNNPGLKESDAYPLNPDSEYGYEKAFSERLYLAYQRNYNLNVRIARFHNIYGPEGTYKGGKEKAPAAMCRKVAETWKKGYGKIDDLTEDYEEFEPIEVWGDGLQTRSFLYIEDCIDAVRLLMKSDFKEPINIGSEEMISINDLAKMVIAISGKSIDIKNIPGPTGVRGRNSDNTLIRQVLNWEPKYSLREGMKKTFQWINSKVNADKF